MLTPGSVISSKGTSRKVPNVFLSLPYVTVSPHVLGHVSNQHCWYRLLGKGRGGGVKRRCLRGWGCFEDCVGCWVRDEKSRVVSGTPNLLRRWKQKTATQGSLLVSVVCLSCADQLTHKLYVHTHGRQLFTCVFPFLWGSCGIYWLYSGSSIRVPDQQSKRVIHKMTTRGQRVRINGQYVDRYCQ